MYFTTDVVIVGAGPVGLLAAIELRTQGVNVLVLERLAAINPAIKAMSLGPLAVEALQRRGMGPALDVAEARNAAVMQAFMQQVGTDLHGKKANISGHFAGLPLLRKDVQKEPQRRNRMVYQQSLEGILNARALALGVDIRRTRTVTGYDEDDDGITVKTCSETIRCAWLIGCDGGRSNIRKLAGFAFPGTPPTVTMYQAIVTLDHPERLLPTGWQRTPRGVFTYGPLPGRLFMLDFSGPPPDRDAPVTMDELEALLRHISAADVRITGLDVAHRWTDNTRLVDSYRQGRVLLAGDAAHVHSPFGGQGLSLGLVDAANLGWKLAAVIHGARPVSLLDTYTEERRPVAAQVLANTLAQLALLRPDPQSGALRDLFAQLLEVDGANRMIGEMTNGLGIRYPGTDGLIGDRPVQSGGATVALYDVMQDGRGVLIDATTDGHAPGLTRVTTATGPSMLIRPDGCIAWSGDVYDAAFTSALQRWF